MPLLPRFNNAYLRCDPLYSRQTISTWISSLFCWYKIHFRRFRRWTLLSTDTLPGFQLSVIAHNCSLWRVPSFTLLKLSAVFNTIAIIMVRYRRECFTFHIGKSWPHNFLSRVVDFFPPQTSMYSSPTQHAPHNHKPCRFVNGSIQSSGYNNFPFNKISQIFLHIHNCGFQMCRILNSENPVILFTLTSSPNVSPFIYHNTLV